MTNKKDYPLWEKEFSDFMDAKPLAPSPYLSENIKTEIRKYQIVLKWIIFLKFASIQVAFSTLTLFLCPQFEIGFTSHDHLAALVHHQGIGFMAVCGAFFLSGGVLLATIFLTIYEIKIIEKSEWIYFPAAALIALLIFYFFGTNLKWIEVLPWFLGGAAGSIICFEITKMIKMHLRLKKT